MIQYCPQCGFKNEAIVKPRFCSDCGQPMDAAAAFARPANQPAFDGGASHDHSRPDRSSFDGEVGVQKDNGAYQPLRSTTGRTNGKQPNRVQFTTLKEVREAGAAFERGAPPEGTDKARAEIIPKLMDECKASETQRAPAAPVKRSRGKRA